MAASAAGGALLGAGVGFGAGILRFPPGRFRV